MKRDVILFPYCLVRTAGGNYTDFQAMEKKSSLTSFRKITQLNKKYKTIQEQLSELLYQHISVTASSTIRQTLIQARRDIYKGRSIEYLSDDIKKNLPILVQKLLTRYRHTQKKLYVLQGKGEQTYEKELLQAKKIFIKLLKTTNFQKGILLSSDSIIKDMKAYVSSNASSKRNVSKLEINLMKYLSRMYCKTSPFSTFTQVSLGTFTDSNISLQPFTQKKQKQQSHIHLNRHLYQNICELLLSNKKIARSLFVTLNNTIQQVDDKLIFLTKQYDHESFQKVAITPALSFLYKLIQRKKLWRYDELITGIINTGTINASQKDLENYIDELLRYGFLEYDITKVGTDLNWEKRFTQKLTPLSKKFSLVKHVLQTIKILNKFAALYKNASVTKREKILSAAYAKYIAMYDQLNSSSETNHDSLVLKPYQIWYEDTVLNYRSFMDTATTNNVKILGNFLRRMDVFDTCVEEKLQIEKFFIDKYKRDATIDLLQLYADYTKEEKKFRHKESHLLKNSQIKERRKQIHTWFKILLQQIRYQRKNTEQINLREQHFMHIPQTDYPVRSSFSSFFQIYKTQGKSMLVFNNTEGGFGRRWSRFLYLFPPKITSTLFSWNKANEKEVILAEPTDTSLFNANIHPPLMPYQICTPGGETSYTSQQIIDMADIQVIYSEEETRLILIDKKSKKRVVVFDLAFQNPTDRSDIYWFLSLFTNDEHHQPYPVLESINNALTKSLEKDTIRILPRIIYEDTVVLQRKAWLISPQTIPLRAATDNDWSYFYKVFTWKEIYNIPNEIFITLDNDKPQFISFTNPLLIKLFEKLTHNSKEAVIIREMLPTSEQLESINHEKTVTEYMAQWYY